MIANYNEFKKILKFLGKSIQNSTEKGQNFSHNLKNAQAEYGNVSISGCFEP